MKLLFFWFLFVMYWCRNQTQILCTIKGKPAFTRNFTCHLSAFACRGRRTHRHFCIASAFVTWLTFWFVVDWFSLKILESVPYIEVFNWQLPHNRWQWSALMTRVLNLRCCLVSQHSQFTSVVCNVSQSHQFPLSSRILRALNIVAIPYFIKLAN